VTSFPRIVGMVHLPALPGAPRFGGDFENDLAAAVRDAEVLAGAGFDAVLVENYGDAPYFPDDVPAVTVAAMTRAVAAVRAAVEIPVGVNVLRNDATAALAVAAATGAAFIRVNVLSGIMTTDQGPIVGRAAEVLRQRRSVAPDVLILADVLVKHAEPPAGITLERAAEETAERALADALVVTGATTGRPPTMATVRKVKDAARHLPVLVGSGVTAATVARFLAAADGVIAGTSLKRSGVTTDPVAPGRAKVFITSAGGTKPATRRD
jgi:membrane complex biogenesis BtpA family protein